MKRIVLFLVVFGIAASMYAQSQLPPYRFAAGSWEFSSERLLQKDANARLAKVNFQAPQSGPMVYEFNALYEGGAEDGHGGFGLHIFGDKAYNGASWGNGNSYLLWLNYDENPINRAIPKGLSAQVYRSHTNSWMDLVQSVDLNVYADYLTDESLSAPVSFKITADGNTGEVRVYDPIDPDTYYFFYVTTKDIPLNGNWAALRTNGIKLSFALD
ncbi:hypothetical protein AGMMS49587_18770 [Spirochaetia bacterium]|nr:hypothetical protein AGMMS49587_18770 [Spirochaetia bacterium]